MRRIGVVTGGRADYGILRPLLEDLVKEPSLELVLYVTGTHGSPEFGCSVLQIEADGFKIHEQIEMVLSSDSPGGVSKAMGLGTIGFAQAYSKLCPDVLVVVGDRFEMHAATIAALPFNIPIAHLLGGEVTEGAIDDALRHSITKLSHLHFVSTREYVQNLLALGEEPWRVILSGAPAVDSFQRVKLLPVERLQELTGFDLEMPPLLVTFHPVTLEYEKTEEQVCELLRALRQFDRPIVLTLPNSDARGRVIHRYFQEFCDEVPFTVLIDNLGTQAYFSLMAISAAMVGNSSSGIIESGLFKLPVVNIGTRQQGRVRGRNVIDVDSQFSSIRDGICQALHPDFRINLEDFINPYGMGGASQQIISTLKSINLDDRLLRKRLHHQDLSSQEINMALSGCQTESSL